MHLGFAAAAAFSLLTQLNPRLWGTAVCLVIQKFFCKQTCGLRCALVGSEQMSIGRFAPDFCITSRRAE